MLLHNNYIVHCNVYHGYLWCVHCVSFFILIGSCVSELHVHVYVPIVIYSLRLFIVVLKELHCLPNLA